MIILLYFNALTVFPNPAEITKIMELPENEIDIGKAVLILSKDAFSENERTSRNWCRKGEETRLVSEIMAL